MSIKFHGYMVKYREGKAVPPVAVGDGVPGSAANAEEYLERCFKGEGAMEEVVVQEHIIKKHVQKTAQRAAEEAAARTAVELCQEFGLGFSETIQKVMAVCGYDRERAKQETARYWVC